MPKVNVFMIFIISNYFNHFEQNIHLWTLDQPKAHGVKAAKVKSKPIQVCPLAWMCAHKMSINVSLVMFGPKPGSRRFGAQQSDPPC